MSKTVIRIEHVSKEYRLGAIGGGTLKGDLQTWMARMRGREDPNSKIGSTRNAGAGERFLALDDVSFEVQKGEALGIIGHNGAGKSTLLKLLCRVTAPSKGKLSYNGRIASMLEVGTGFHSELTGRENVYMNGAILGMTKQEISRKFDEIVRFAEMEQFIDTPVKRYSSGMYVKLAFAVAAHLDSEIMIMDEVLAVGDVNFQKKCLRRMRAAATEEGRTVLYVSHNMNTIRELCDRCIVMDHGKIIYDGDVEKAIGIYIGANDYFRTNYEYTSSSHSRGGRKQALIESIRFEDGFTGQCTASREVRLTLGGRAVDKLQNLRFHFEIEAPNGNRIGTMFTDKEISVNKGESFTVPMSLDLSGLAPDRYIFHAVAETLESYETYAWQDSVSHAFTLEILADPDSRKMGIWATRSWGNVKLKDIRIRADEA